MPTAETMVEATSPCFMLDHTVDGRVESIPKSSVFNYGDLLDALARIPELDNQHISHLCPRTEAAEKAGFYTRITVENGDQWVKECKNKVEHTWFTVACCSYDPDDLVSKAADDYTDDCGDVVADDDFDSEI